jgi:hypothetical protein
MRGSGSRSRRPGRSRNGKQGGMIPFVESTGMLGDEIPRHLTARGLSVKALVRATSDPAQGKKLKEGTNANRLSETQTDRSVPSP